MLRFIFFLTLFSFSVNVSFSQTEQDLITQTFEALKALYRSTDGGNWINDWDTTADPMSMRGFNDWYGIGVSTATLNLVGLHLYRNNLTGSIPPEIGNLVNLKGLYLYENNPISANLFRNIFQFADFCDDNCLVFPQRCDSTH